MDSTKIPKSEVEKMQNLDLNFDNYSLEDILNLFNLSPNFGEFELKNAKKMVLMTHPDKSKLDPEVFLFFSKAYKKVWLLPPCPFQPVCNHLPPEF